jgi:glutamyl-tRNA synthetase
VLNAVATGDETTLGKVAQPLRMAISVTAVSPPIDLTAALIGKA